MRVLFAVPWVPHPPDAGGRTRTWSLLRETARRAELHLRVVLEPGRGEADLAPLAEVAASVRGFPRGDPGRGAWLRSRPERWFASPELARELARELADGERPFDVVHLDDAALLPALPARARHGAAVVVHHHRLHSAAPRALPGVDGWRAALEVPRLRRLEARGAREGDLQVFCGEDDARAFAARHPRAPLAVVPSGFDPERFFADASVARERDLVLFLGTLSYPPNVDALRWLVREILPGVRAVRPAARLAIVGHDGGPDVTALAGEGVELVGGVDDPRPWLARASALAVPLRVGGGTRLKIVEALACATPVVSTSIGAQGLALAHGEHLHLADHAPAFARTLAQVLEHPDRAARLAEAGRARVAERYPWSRLAGDLLAAWERARAARRS